MDDYKMTFKRSELNRLALEAHSFTDAMYIHIDDEIHWFYGDEHITCFNDLDHAGKAAVIVDLRGITDYLEGLLDEDDC